MKKKCSAGHCPREIVTGFGRCALHLDYARLHMRSRYIEHNDGRRCGACGNRGHYRSTCLDAGLRGDWRDEKKGPP